MALREGWPGHAGPCKNSIPTPGFFSSWRGSQQRGLCTEVMGQQRLGTSEETVDIILRQDRA